MVETKETECIPSDSACDVLECLYGTDDCNESDLCSLVFTNTAFLAPMAFAVIVLSKYPGLMSI